MANEASLLKSFLKRTWASRLNWILTDSPLFERLLIKQRSVMPFERLPFDATALIQASRTTNLFGESPLIVSELPNKLTEKQWLATLESFGDLMFSRSCLIFGSQNHKKLFSQHSPPGQWSVWYSPIVESELRECCEVLLLSWPRLGGSLKGDDLRSFCERTLVSYEGNLLDCDLHFERMDRFGLSFEDALLPSVESSTYQVVDTISRGDALALSKQFEHFLNEGGEVGALFASLVVFLRQWVSLKSHLPGDLRQAFLKAGIPFPAQKRFKKALDSLQEINVIEFLLAAPYIEKALRVGGKSHAQGVLVELLALIHPNQK